MSDGALSVSVLDSEEEAVFMEEIRRQREEAAQRHRCCICGTLYTQDEGQLLWHINPWFFCAYHIHDMQQRSFEQDYHPGTPVSEVLRNAGVLVTDEQGRNWFCICRPCQRMPNYQQQRRPEPAPHTTPSRSSNEVQPSGSTINPSTLDQIPPGPNPREEYREDFDPSSSSYAPWAYAPWDNSWRSWYEG